MFDLTSESIRVRAMKGHGGALEKWPFQYVRIPSILDVPQVRFVLSGSITEWLIAAYLSHCSSFESSLTNQARSPTAPSAPAQLPVTSIGVFWASWHAAVSLPL